MLEREPCTSETYHVGAHDLPAAALVSLDESKKYAHRARHASAREAGEDVQWKGGLVFLSREHLTNVIMNI